MPIYTRMGDKGYSSILHGIRLPKDHLLFEVIGSIDELNSYIGIVRSKLKYHDINEILKYIQNRLTDLNVEIQARYVDKLDRYHEYILKKTDVTKLEEYIDMYARELPELNRLILFSGSIPGTEMFYARAICRRVERNIVKLFKKVDKFKDSDIIPFINRLSDLFFILGRYLNYKEGAKEEKWRE